MPYNSVVNFAVRSVACLALVCAGLFCGDLVSRPISAADPERNLQQLLKQSTGSVKIPAGVVVLHAEITLSGESHDLHVDGAGVTIQLAPEFKGRAALVVSGGHNIQIAGLTIDGNRERIHHEVGDLAPSDVPVGRFMRDNGILAENTSILRMEGLTFKNIAGYPILVSASENVRIHGVTITDSGSRNARHRNNGTGGILLEEGTHDFEVSGCELRHVLGNGIWTHSRYGSARDADGRITGNKISEVARDAIQVGHATRMTVEKNTGVRIGYPLDAVDHEAQAIPVAIDTAGNTDATKYLNNSFEEVNGKCMDLDGFHDGEVRGNSCINRQDRDEYPNGNFGIVMNNSNPDMESRNILIWGNTLDGFIYGGLALIGSGHRVSHNHFTHLNMAHCNDEAARYGCLYAAGEPDLLRSGIYLRNKAHRPAVTRDNIVEDNEVSGFGMSAKCVVLGPGVEAAQNRIANNNCMDDATVSARLQSRSITREMALTSLRMGGSSNAGKMSSSPSRQVE